jgi:hypothetical protein
LQTLDSQAPASRVGQVIGGRYHLQRRLGAGGFAVVYEAENTWTRRRVAIKLLNVAGADGGATQRFLQEARVASRLRHPNIVDVLDMGRDDADGTLFIVQELLEGGDLASLLKARGPLPVMETLDLLVPVMGALIAAHAGGVVHRDIKPANILIVRGPLGTLPKLIDFGISKVIDAEGLAQTRTGVLLGTPYYMSPEQVRGDKDIDGRSDVWAVGAMVHEMLSGQRPFDAANQVGVMYQILERPVPRLDTVASVVPRDLAEVVERALCRDRQARLPDMTAFLEALLGCPSVQATEAGRTLRARHGASLVPATVNTQLAEPQVSPFSSTEKVPAAGRSRAVWWAAGAVVGLAAAGAMAAFWPARGGGGGRSGAVRDPMTIMGIRSVVRSQATHLEGCYDEAVRKNPAIAGRELTALLELTVGPDGRASRVAASGVEAAPGLEQCLLRQFSSLRYPTADGGTGPTTIRYPLKFNRR